MKSTPDLCDQYPELVQAVEPMFSNFGGRESFGGQVVTVKCFEDNSRVKELVSTPGEGRVMVVDAGGSMRRACLGDMLAEKASASCLILSDNWLVMIIVSSSTRMSF